MFLHLIAWVQLCLMLQNDFVDDNDNDGFIIPMPPMTPATGSSSKSPLQPWRSQSRRNARGVPTPDNTEQGGEGFISYQHFLSHYWNHFPQGVAQGLGVCIIYLVYSVNNFGMRPCFGFWRDFGGY